MEGNYCYGKPIDKGVLSTYNEIEAKCVMIYRGFQINPAAYRTDKASFTRLRRCFDGAALQFLNNRLDLQEF